MAVQDFANAKPTVLFLHGFLGSPDDWEIPAKALSQQGYAILCPALPGHGEETNPLELSTDFDDAVAKLAELVRTKSPQGVHLVAYSMGGRLGMALLLRHPELVATAFILSASPGIKDSAARNLRYEKDQQLAQIIEDDFARFIDSWYNQPLFGKLKQSDQFKQIEKRRQQANPSRIAQAMRILSVGKQPSLWSALPENERPLHVLVGSLDDKYVAIGDSIRRLCPQACVHSMPGCSHALHLENPSGLTDYLLEQLDAAS